HFAIIEVETGLALDKIIAAPMHRQIDKIIAVEVHGMDIDLIARRSDFQMAARFESPLAIAELEDHSWPLMEPVHFAIAVEIDEGVSSPLSCNHRCLAKTQPTWSRFVEPPFTPAILPGHLQIKFAIFIDVIGKVDFGRRISASG